MKITIIKKSSGIHPHLNLNIEDGAVEDTELINTILVLVDRYNEQAVAKA